MEGWPDGPISAYLLLVPCTEDTESTAANRLSGVALVWRSMAAAA